MVISGLVVSSTSGLDCFITHHHSSIIDRQLCIALQHSKRPSLMLDATDGQTHTTADFFVSAMITSAVIVL